MRPLLPTLALGLLTLPGPAATAADTEVVASAARTIQPTGPREGDAGSLYFNVEGKANGPYASFGLLTFPAPRAAGKVEGLTLTLVQSVARFSKDGKVKLYLLPIAPEPTGLKFTPEIPGGMGKTFEQRVPIGAAEFKKAETGHVDAIVLTLDDVARRHLDERLAAGGEIRLLVVPDDDAVAATYFGTSPKEAGRKPRLTLKVAAP